jgi:hypothetical protein
MRAESVIYTLLTGSTSLQALLGGALPAMRVYASRLPQNTVMPAVAYQLVSGTEMTPIDAAAGRQLMRSRVQVTAMGKKYSDVKNVIEAVRIACLYQSGVIAGVTVLAVLRDSVGPDLRDDDLNLYLQSIDWIVMHYET